MQAEEFQSGDWILQREEKIRRLVLLPDLFPEAARHRYKT
jgi:hypothetical protein